MEYADRKETNQETDRDVLEAEKVSRVQGCQQCQTLQRHHLPCVYLNLAIKKSLINVWRAILEVVWVGICDRQMNFQFFKCIFLSTSEK
jgi:hypothetical protein